MQAHFINFHTNYLPPYFFLKQRKLIQLFIQIKKLYLFLQKQCVNNTFLFVNIFNSIFIMLSQQNVLTTHFGFTL